MSLSYADSLTSADPGAPQRRPTIPEMTTAEAHGFTPVYARGAARRRGKIRSWMILAPIGVVTVAALGAWAVMNADEAAVPVPAEPAPLTSAPLASGPLIPETALTIDAATPVEAAAELIVEPAPVEAASTPAPAPAARTARPAPAPVAEPAEAAIVVPAGPQAYEAVVAAEAESAEPTPLIVVRPD